MSKKIIRFEDKLFEVDLDKPEMFVIEADGTKRDPTREDGDWLTVLWEGAVISEEKVSAKGRHKWCGM